MTKRAARRYAGARPGRLPWTSLEADEPKVRYRTSGPRRGARIRVTRPA